MTINVNAARAARREAIKEKPSIEIDDAVFDLPVEMPFEVVEKMGRLADVQASEQNTLLLEVFECLLDGQYEQFMQHKPTIQDLSAILAALPAEYGFGGLGESQPSEG